MSDLTADLADDDGLLRLAVWLADVAAEAAVAPTASDASLTAERATRRAAGRAETPPVAGPAIG